MSNPFLDIAEHQMSSPAKARARAAQKRTDKAALERDTLSKIWREQQRKRRDELLAGRYGADAQALLDFMQTMTLASAPGLIELVRAGPWHQADADTRFQILGMIDTAIVALREKHGLPAFDDPLPGQPDNVFRIVRSILTPSPEHELRSSPSVGQQSASGRSVIATVQMKV
jgi:hypothetical protein